MESQSHSRATLAATSQRERERCSLLPSPSIFLPLIFFDSAPDAAAHGVHNPLFSLSPHTSASSLATQAADRASLSQSGEKMRRRVRERERERMKKREEGMKKQSRRGDIKMFDEKIAATGREGKIERRTSDRRLDLLLLPHASPPSLAFLLSFVLPGLLSRRATSVILSPPAAAPPAPLICMPVTSLSLSLSGCRCCGTRGLLSTAELQTREADARGREAATERRR